MHYLQIFLLCSCLFCLSPNYTSDFNPEKGLVAWYSFDQCDARDDAEGGSNGKLFGDISCKCGVAGEGLMLNGIDDYIEFYGNVNLYFTTSDFTVSFYFKPMGYSTFYQSLLSKRALCDENYMMDIRLDLNNRFLPTEVHQNEWKYYRDISPNLEGEGPWYHFALVREGNTAKTYINGKLKKETTRCSGVDISNDAVLNFSNSPCTKGGRTNRFRGVIDELRVYDYPFSDKAIWELYQLAPIELAEIDCVS